MSWCCPFMVRPPEDERKRRKPGEPERPPFFQLLTGFIRQQTTAVWTAVASKFRREVQLHTAPLEVRMKNARTARLTQLQTEQLLRDPSPLVRIELVFNDTISGETLERLKRDPDFTVSTVARRKEMQLR